MSKFRKKPVEVEAWLLTKDNWREMEEMKPGQISFIGNRIGPGENDLDCLGLNIKTLEGDMFAEIGDWIIQGIAGEFYPCKPVIFEATYDAVV